MRYLLDTSALLAHQRQENGANQVQKLFEDESAEIFIASASLAEFGRRLHDLGTEGETIQRILQDYQFLMTDVVDIDSEIALQAFSLVIKNPLRIPLIDTLIAACALKISATLVHRDKHMARLSQAQMILPDKP